MAARHGIIPRLKAILQYPEIISVHEQDANGNTALHCSVEAGHMEATRLLLYHGVPPSVGNCDGNTPLHVAVLDGNAALVGLLLKHDRLQTSSATTTRTHESTTTSTITVVITAKAPVNAKNLKSLTPLHLACMAGAHAIACILIQHRANPCLCDSEGDTPLHLAAMYRHTAVADLLLRNGASPHAVNYAGFAVRDYALQREAAGVLTLLDKEDRIVVVWQRIFFKLRVIRCFYESGQQAKRERICGKLREMGINPKDLMCPITQDFFYDAVLACDGHTYERSAILAWFARGHKRSPITNALLPSIKLTPNFAVRSILSGVGENNYR